MSVYLVFSAEHLAKESPVLGAPRSCVFVVVVPQIVKLRLSVREKLKGNN